MTSIFIDLLRQISDGVTVYEPFSRKGPEIKDFQDTVARLLEMERLGLVRQVFTQVREIAGTEYYDLAMVPGGLTAEGARLLQQQQQQQGMTHG